MKFFCVLFPFSLNRINIFARFSLFVVFLAVCLLEEINFNNQCVSLPFPDGYSRVLFNLFPRKNPGINSQPGPVVSYGYKYNLAHPTRRSNNKDSEIDPIGGAESALRPSIIVPRLLVSPTIPSLGENRPVIFESTKDVKRLVPGVPLLFKLRKPSDEYSFSPWSLSSNPPILLAGSVIPSNFHYKYRSDATTSTTKEQVITTPPFPEVDTVEHTEKSIISQVNPRDAYLPVTENKDDSITTVSSGKPEEIKQEHFPSPFPLPRPSLKQIDKDVYEVSSQSDGENQSFYSENLDLLLPPNFSENKDEFDLLTLQTTIRPLISVRNYTAAENLLKDSDTTDNIHIANFQVSEKIDDRQTTLSTIYDAAFAEDDNANISDVTTGNKLTRQVQEPDFDEFLDVPPLHYERDPTTEKTTNPSEDGTNKPRDNLPTNTNNLRERQNSSESPSGRNISQNQRLPKSDSFTGRTTPDSILATPILPVEPEPEYTENSTPKISGNNNRPSPPFQGSTVESNFDINSQADGRLEEEPELPSQFNSQNGVGSSLSVHIPNSEPDNVPLDSIQQLISALAATIGKARQNAPQSGPQQFFTFHIGAININFDNKGSTVPNKYTILSNIANSPSSESSPVTPSVRLANSPRKPSTTNFTAPNAFSFPTSSNNQYSSPPKLSNIAMKMRLAETPFTVPLPKPIKPSDPEEDNERGTSTSQNQGGASSVPSLSQNMKIFGNINAKMTATVVLPTPLPPQEELEYSDGSDPNVSPQQTIAIQRVEVTTENIANTQSNDDTNEQPKAAVFPTLLVSQEKSEFTELKPSLNYSNIPHSLPVKESVLPQLIVPIEERVYQLNDTTN